MVGEGGGSLKTLPSHFKNLNGVFVIWVTIHVEDFWSKGNWIPCWWSLHLPILNLKVNTYILLIWRGNTLVYLVIPSYLLMLSWEVTIPSYLLVDNSKRYYPKISLSYLVFLFLFFLISPSIANLRIVSNMVGSIWKLITFMQVPYVPNIGFYRDIKLSFTWTIVSWGGTIAMGIRLPTTIGMFPFWSSSNPFSTY